MAKIDALHLLATNPKVYGQLELEDIALLRERDNCFVREIIAKSIKDKGKH